MCKTECESAERVHGSSYEVLENYVCELSVIVPTYNHAQFLGEAVQSVLDQTYQDYEIIIVDDGSTDNTREVLERFCDPRIRYVYQENRGLGAARNTGIRGARGALVALLDADDVWKPDFLHRAANVLHTNLGIGAAYAGFRYMNAEGRPLSQTVCRVVPSDQFRQALLRGNWLCPSAVVVRKSVFGEIGLFDETHSACEDLDMWLRISLRFGFEGIPNVLLLHRRIGNNMSDDVDRMTEEMAAVLEKHVGPLDGAVDDWSDDQWIAASSYHKYCIEEYLAQGRLGKSVRSLYWILKYRRKSALELDLWYSLATVHQSKGHRGEFSTWDLKRAEFDTMSLLDSLAEFQISYSDLRKMRSQAHFALALFSYGIGRLGAARRHLLQSFLKTPACALRLAWISLAARLLPGMAMLRPMARQVRHLSSNDLRIDTLSR